LAVGRFEFGKRKATSDKLLFKKLQKFEAKRHVIPY